MQLKPGSKLQYGKYEIIRTLGWGDFGITYEVEHTVIHRRFAIKEFFRWYCNRDESTNEVKAQGSHYYRLLMKQFIMRSAMIAQMDHSHIVRIFDVFEENGTAYYVMEYLDGNSLRRPWHESSRFPLTVALNYIRQVGDALSYMHGQNFLHFDVKPSKILVNKSGDAVLIDFGFLGDKEDDDPEALSYYRLYPYQPLERRMADIFTPATDVYSLGATLYTLLTGEVPPSAVDVIEEGLPPFPAGIPQPLQAAIVKAMSPRRKDRPQSIKEFMATLPYVVPENLSFHEAFEAARKELGPGGSFIWHGNVYSTYRVEDLD